MKFTRPNGSDELYNATLEEGNLRVTPENNIVVPVVLWNAILSDSEFMHGYIEGVLSVVKHKDDTK